MSPVPKEFAELDQLVSRVAEKAQFPLRNFRDLASALGGEEAEIHYQGRGQKLSQVRRMIPDDFFPVESREDLIAKIAHLQKPKVEFVPGEQKKERPANAGEPPAELAGAGQRKGSGLPGLHGIKQKD